MKMYARSKETLDALRHCKLTSFGLHASEGSMGTQEVIYLYSDRDDMVDHVVTQRKMILLSKKKDKYVHQISILNEFGNDKAVFSCDECELKKYCEIDKERECFADIVFINKHIGA